MKPLGITPEWIEASFDLNEEREIIRKRVKIGEIDIRYVEYEAEEFFKIVNDAIDNGCKIRGLSRKKVKCILDFDDFASDWDCESNMQCYLRLEFDGEEENIEVIDRLYTREMVKAEEAEERRRKAEAKKRAKEKKAQAAQEERKLYEKLKKKYG